MALSVGAGAHEREGLLFSLRALPASAWTLFLGIFINKLGNYLQIFLVLYLVDKGYPPAIAGLALGFAAIGNLIGNAVGGALGDRLGRRETIGISMFGSAAGTAILPIVNQTVLMLILVGVIGVFSQVYRPIAGALLDDVVPKSRRVTASATHRLAINLGMAAGPIIAGFVSSRSYPMLFYLDALSSFAYGVIAIAFLPKAQPSPVRGVHERSDYGVVLRDRSYMLFLLAAVAAEAVYSQSFIGLPVHVQALKLPNSAYGTLLGINALLVVALELVITERTRRLPAPAVSGVGITIVGLGLAATGMTHTFSALVVTVVIWTFGEMIYLPIAGAQPVRYSGSSSRARYQGAYGVASTAATALGAMVGGVLLTRGETLLWTSCLVMTVAGALVATVSGPKRSTATGAEPGTSDAEKGDVGTIVPAFSALVHQNPYLPPGESVVHAIVAFSAQMISTDTVDGRQGSSNASCLGRRHGPVALLVQTPLGGGVNFVRQVSPEVLSITDDVTWQQGDGASSEWRVVRDIDPRRPLLSVYSTGTWADGEERAYHFCLSVTPQDVGERNEIRAARVSLLVDGKPVVRVPVRALWTDNQE